MRAFVFSDVIQPPATKIPRHRDRIVVIDRTQKDIHSYSRHSLKT